MYTNEQQPYLIEELEGDTLTPISIYQSLSGRKKFLLESSLKHEKSGRYSFIGVEPAFELKGFGAFSQIVKNKETKVIEEKPLELLKKLLPSNNALNSIFPLIGGAIGYVGYDVIRQYENIGEELEDELNVPDVHLMFFEDLVVFDHLEQKVYLVATPIEKDTTIENLQKQLDKRRREILTPIKNIQEKSFKLSPFKATISKDEFMDSVKKAKEYIVEGDIFQVVLSQRLHADIEGDPFSYYRKLRVKNQSPYMYYLDFEEYVVAGSSPESLIKAADEYVMTNPIAGTRPRGKSEEEDTELERDLLADEKELAEHRMLVDLGRNDIGRVSDFGSVTVNKYMKIEKYKHVMHIVSEVSGKLRDGKSAIDALSSTLPAGTVSGAPKIRAMEIINELEKVKRGIYSGAIGYFSANGNMDFALAIRTMVIKDKKAYIQAGAGIVHDSIPEKEYEETIHKLRVFLEDQNDFIN